jgi:hypothetical protein
MTSASVAVGGGDAPGTVAGCALLAKTAIAMPQKVLAIERTQGLSVIGLTWKRQCS